MEDIKEEIEYWSNAVICYVLGSNPPPVVMNGYFHRIWGKLGIDKVAQVNRGVFLVRFAQAESRMKVLEDGVQMFDQKPVIIKPWSPDIDTRKESFSTVPIWIRLPGLDIKYWGKNALTKITGLVGKPMKADRATTWKERMTFARVLVKVTLDQPYAQTIMFENEVGKIVEQRVHYEWKPTLCKECNNYGHEVTECRKHTQMEKQMANKKEWEKDHNSAGETMNQNKARNDEVKQKQNEKEKVETGNQQENRREGKKATYIQKGNWAQRRKDVPGSNINLGNSFGELGETSIMMLIEQEREGLEKQMHNVDEEHILGKGGAFPEEMDNIGFWNTRGFNRLAKQEEVNIFLHQCKVSLFGLLETKIKRRNAQKASLNLCKGWSLTNI
ncbi:PREDICTED: uncharacterized protein LOC109230204 [Nicotiana attenuata]|uniref:uncharacterized protein LOC109230204 n=1 Tax=Nicotiana attenuata TaxID=49451 RepID=UPI000905CEEB|nr:PREDICTED: uncharacterized protein LOC109230204 [Nicotiana attenuata]